MTIEVGADRKVSRRSFMKWSGIAGGSAALVATTAHLGMPGIGTAANSDGMLDAEQTVWSACLVNCGARCPLRFQVKDGTVARVLPDNTGGDEIGNHRIPACPRGRSIRQRIYSPDRIKKPLKRKPGTKRGDEQWEEISWEQALDEIAEKYQQLLADYGPESQFYAYATGVIAGTVSGSYYGGALQRLLKKMGGFLSYYGDYSTGGITEAMRVTLGGYIDSNSTDDLVNSKLYVLWGHSPMETKMCGGSEAFYAQKLIRDTNVRTIVVDPRHSDSVQLMADEHVALKPGTDAALIAGIAHVLISEDLHEQEFLDEYCVGFDESTLPEGAPENSSYRAYVMGDGPDGIEKTPEWASSVTGTPVDTIVKFARELGNNKPSMIHQGWGAQRCANGENQSRAIITLNAMLGNVGLPGGGAGTYPGSSAVTINSAFDADPNPVTKKISHFTWPDAIDHGAEMKGEDGVRDWDEDGNPIWDPQLEVPIKAIWAYGSNTLINQHSDINGTKELLRDDSKCELIVLCDNQMTSSAKFADYVLPGTSNAEEGDVVQQGLAANMGYSIVATKAIDPLYESKTIYEICTELARRLGIEEEFTEGKTQEDWARQIIEDSREANPGMPGYDELQEMGVWKVDNGARVALREFREDPEANPLDTPSGKIEIYSAEVARKAEEWNLPDGDVVTALPEQINTWEDFEAAKTNSEFPLQMISYHFKGRTHSSYGNVPWLKQAHRQVIWINPVDAKPRGIENGDEVIVYNGRGQTKVEAKVTPRIFPGVTTLPEGAWYNPDKDGVDQGGGPNVLTKYHPTALAKSNPQYTNLVEVKKA
ncbi:dimethyl sulfoxide reductase subunit A [Flaviflexus ciconiae]|uniref:Dimethyl sulfoxide reductase subunit A n=2 Tax=Flaviflexus TaxID=1522056 RepID=A0A3Q9G4Q2_9ACTO|nr:DMSO/selenate family reductase complex A subunit [Flaviflexus ciconiae]AZQ77335.1 dimethyl sulfoxide reductase subunit A [Flaviflexus ciconiae]